MSSSNDNGNVDGGGGDQQHERRPSEDSALLAATRNSERRPELLGHRFSLWLATVLPQSYGAHASLSTAWSYFEQVTLSRRMKKADGTYTMAPTGTTDRPTTLYPAWRTPQRELRDFGTGIAVYFETLRILVVICLIAGILYIPTILYYQSDAYSPSQFVDGVIDDPNIADNMALRGSIMCSDTKWVPCPNCTLSEWRDAPHRIAKFDNDLTFVLKNTCTPLRWQEGVNHVAVMVFLIGAITLLGYRQTALELSYDEDILTASDFSIVVHNPPPDAKDPDEWKTFFEQFGEVVYCTVALDNEDLVNALVQRRAKLQKASFKMEHCESSNEALQAIPDDLAREKPRLHEKIQELEEKCRQLMAEENTCPASSVFVTFETEQMQRQALKALSVPKIHLATNDIRALIDSGALMQEHLFRGNVVLEVEEAKEPTVIRWKDLEVTTLTKVLQSIVSYSITLGLIIMGFKAVEWAFEVDVNLAAYLIAILNVAVPNILKLANTIESHAREETYQASLYAKVSLFRFVNTAIVTSVIKPFTATIADDANALIPSVYAVLKAEIVVAPILHMLDIPNNIKRFILAPRAANQAAMNSYFRGSVQFLGEKYTNMTKIIFLCMYYAVIFPPSFFFGALAIAMNYVTDKFLLLRSWGPMPELGDDVAMLSRQVFFPFVLVMMAIMSEFYWSASPFDDLCDADMYVGKDSYPKYIGSHEIETLSSDPESFEVTLSGDGSEKLYRFCDQDFTERLSALLNFLYEEKDDWMSPNQQTLTYLFGLGCALMLVILALVICVRDIVPSYQDAMDATYETIERDSGQRYSDQEEIKAYVPTIPHRLFGYPLFTCDIRDVNLKHIGWTDPYHNHEYYSLANDVRWLQNGYPDVQVLNVIKYWGPKSENYESVGDSGNGSTGNGDDSQYGSF